MLRTTVYLDEEVGSSIRRLANLQGRAQADLIREALSEYVLKAEGQLDGKLPPGVGSYRSGRADVSAKADELLKRAARKRR
jgi:predicted transcriptional regulator